MQSLPCFPCVPWAYNEKTAHELATAILASFVPEFAAFRAKFAELEALEP